MGILDDATAEQLRARFAERLVNPVELRLYTRPGTGRLILPSGYGCATCDDARELAEAVVATAPEKLSLEVVDVSAVAAEVSDVPLLTVERPGEEARIRFQGLPAGYEFATVIDAIERVSSGEHGLSEASAAALAKIDQDVEVLVFATPT